MSEDPATYSTGKQTRADKMWIAGWTLAKYEEQGLLPETDNDIEEWFYGFTIGTVEAILYDKLNNHLERLLQTQQRTLNQIQNWRRNT